MTLAKLLVLLAVLFMPLGMTPAVAAGHSAHAAMPMQHCPEQAPAHRGKAGFVECTMACSAALPAAEVSQDQPQLIVCMPDRPGVAQQLDGLHPETATPPPKHS